MKDIRTVSEAKTPDKPFSVVDAVSEVYSNGSLGRRHWLFPDSFFFFFGYSTWKAELSSGGFISEWY